ncbi:hypothetical protein L484_016007 [Morus notabilis]|uniref:Uncharacterized protein n=1 Tax=Morus notabilis TaxID=981085 RepID=W9RMK7_9ROSA|nr:hypothetical protein L484_016007 [Morus notabilis]
MREASELIDVLERVNVNGVLQDRREWINDSSGLFTVRSFFSDLITDSSVQRFPFV